MGTALSRGKEAAQQTSATGSAFGGVGTRNRVGASEDGRSMLLVPQHMREDSIGRCCRPCAEPNGTVSLCSATKALGGMVVEGAIPCFGSKTLGEWKEQRAQKRASHLAPVPAPTQVPTPPGLPVPLDC